MIQHYHFDACSKAGIFITIILSVGSNVPMDGVMSWPLDVDLSEQRLRSEACEKRGAMSHLGRWVACHSQWAAILAWLMKCVSRTTTQ